MKKKLFVLSNLFIASAVVLSACGSGSDLKQANNAANPPAVTQPEEKNNAAHNPDIKKGTAQLLSTAKQLRKAATAANETKMKELGPKLEEAWASFEDEVKPKYPEIYEQVEKSLNPAVAAAKASAIDKEALLKLDNQLIQVLYDLSGKLITADEVKAGANQMLATTNELKKEIEAGNEAKVKELGPKLEEVWKTFEDGVPPRSAELYEKIEKNLNPEVAGSQKSPLDKQVLGQLNEGLTQSLNELIHSL